MLYLVKTERLYPPETVAAMTTAFDTVYQSLPTQIHDDEGVREALALVILRHVDRGERDPERLTDLALRELIGSGSPDRRPFSNEMIVRLGDQKGYRARGR
jgi:hypothetical protein